DGGVGGDLGLLGRSMRAAWPARLNDGGRFIRVYRRGDGKRDEHEGHREEPQPALHGATPVCACSLSATAAEAVSMEISPPTPPERGHWPLRPQRYSLSPPPRHRMASPPPPIPPSRTSVDLARCFTFVTDDPAWVSKILIGGVFTFATTFLVGAFFVGGYWSRLLRRVAAGEARPLPEWDDLGGLFEDGLPIVGLLVLYGLAVFVVTAAPA